MLSASLVPEFVFCPFPAFVILAYADFSVNYASFSGFYPPRGYVADDQRRWQYYKAFAGHYISVNHASYGNVGTGNAAPHAGTLPDNNPSFCVEVSLYMAVYPCKAGSFDIAPDEAPRTDYRINGEFILFFIW
jgi:hypothetical protein